MLSDKDAVSEENIGKMCCLGQVALQCGIEEKHIKGISAPSGVEYEYRKKLPEWIQEVSGDLLIDVDRAMTINDGGFVADSIREEQLKALFLDNGDEIEFVD